MEGLPLGVRKGAWTEEEDLLLKKCIEIHGEGKWHQVPSKAGLNRCRKSCRLRWLNYLKPNIKRGDFEDDEVDLIIRLHKLLGNRWSLIAGRIPGRTANDVKNYWNTHLKKFKPSPDKDWKQKGHHPRCQTPSKYPSNSSNSVVVIKPRPRILGNNNFVRFDCRNDGNNSNNNNDVATTSNNWLATGAGANNQYKSNHCNPSDNEEIMWWENLLMNDNEIDEQHQGGGDGCFNYINSDYLSGILGLGNSAKLNGMDEEEISGARGMGKGVEEGNNESSWDQLFCDVELWNVYNPEPRSCA